MFLPWPETVDSPSYTQKFNQKFIHIAAKKPQRLQIGVFGKGHIARIPYQKESSLVLGAILFVAAQNPTSTRQRGQPVIAAVNSAHGGVDYIEIRFAASENFA